MTRGKGRRTKGFRKKKKISERQVITVKKHLIPFLGKVYQGWEIIDRRYEPQNRMHYRFVVEMPYSVFQKFLRVMRHRKPEYADIFYFSYLVTFGSTIGAKI